MTAKIITLGHEKGGTGKSTLAINLAAGFLQEGKKVAVLDLDGRQQTISHFFKKRKETKDERYPSLPMPFLAVFSAEAPHGELAMFDAEMQRLKKEMDVIVIDTPGSHAPLAVRALEITDVLLSPVNTSFFDLDVMAEASAAGKFGKFGVYAETLWAVRKARAALGRPPLKWLLTFNRSSHIFSRHKGKVEELAQEMSKMLGFTITSPVRERTIYQELFLEGLSICDLNTKGIPFKLNFSHLSARQEIRNIANLISFA